MRRTNRALLIAIFCAFSVAALSATYLVAVYLPRTDADSVEVELPPLVGTAYAEDDDRLPRTLYDVVFDYRTDAATAPGTVLLQDPVPGSVRRVIPDRSRCVVRLTISTGAATTTLAHLIGTSARETALQLRAKGLIVRLDKVTRNDLSPGQVVAVSPPEGTVVREGEVVTLTESEVTTRRVLRVPDVLGSPAAAANATLVLRGLRPTEPIYQPSVEPPGTVIAQIPLPGTLVVSGRSATLTLSAGGLSAADEELEMEGEG